MILVGPTASGKTAVACEIAKHLPVEMISCDSMQVYRGMPILTQAPSPKIQRALTAHLVNCLSVEREYSAAMFRKNAEKLIPQIFKRKKIPLLVGGTGLYLRALLDGLFETRPGTPALKLPDDVPPAEKEKRHRVLLSAQRAAALRKNQSLVGRTLEVLFESSSKKDASRYVGRTREYKRVVAFSEWDCSEAFRQVRITGAADETLLGEIVIE